MKSPDSLKKTARFSHPLDGNLGSGLKWSITVHLGLALAIVVKSLVFPDKTIPFIPSLRVDLVALPDVLKKDKHLIDPSSIPEESRSPSLPKNAETESKIDPNEMVINEKSQLRKKMITAKEMEKKEELERKKDMKSALARIKSLNKINQELKNEEAKNKQAYLVKGNILSKGSSLSADARESTEATYFDVLRARLQGNWELPVWVARQNHSAQVQIYVEPFGGMRRFHFVKSSGSEPFDAAIKQCLERSQPFPKPPEEIASSLMVDGILVGFPL